MTQTKHQELQQKYQILSPIARGGFGIVYRGKDLVFDKPIAIKAIDPKFLDDQKYVDLFLAEAKNAAKLSHPNIVNIYDLVQDENGAYYIVMEYVEGNNLEKILNQLKKHKTVLPPNLAVYVVKEICKALEYAHNKRNPLNNQPLKLVHRDISPSNIIISSEGRVKLIDFGIAQLKFARQKKGEIVLAGKLPYVAPEFVTDSSIDRRADIFSLGVVFFEMLTGERLFDPKNSEEAVHLLKKYKPDQKKLENKKIPEKLRKIIRKMVQKKPEDRYFGANGVYMDLVDYLMENAESVELNEELLQFLKKIDSASPEIEEEQKIESEKKLPSKERKSDDEEQKTIAEKRVIEKPENGKDKSSAQTAPRNENDGKDELDKILVEIESEYAQEKRLGIISRSHAAKKQRESQPKFISQLKLADPKIVDSAPDFVEENGEKTVIDVVRLSAKRYHALFKRVAIALIIILLATLAADVYFQFSALGSKIYSLLFSSEIKLVTVPPGARVYIDEKRVSGTTPVTIKELEPGVHRLTLSLDGFAPIVRALYIPKKGQLKIAGSGSVKKGRTYIFHFKSTIELSSEPVGSVIFINGVEYPEKTPTTIEWEAGKPLQIAMEMADFGKIDGLTIDVSRDTAEISKPEFWTFERTGSIINNFRVLGRLRKLIKVRTYPEGVNVFVDGEQIAQEDGSSELLLPLSRGVHEILFRKQGFNDKLVSLKVDEKAVRDLSIIMDRPVRIVAREFNAPDSSDIFAKVVRVVAAGKNISVERKTPCVISIPAVSSEIHFEADGYEPLRLTVGAEAREVVAELKPKTNPVNILVKDALTGLPINGAKIFYKTGADSAAAEAQLGVTDEDGVLAAQLRSGSYLLRASRQGYYDRQIKADVTDKANFEFKLIIH